MSKTTTPQATTTPATAMAAPPDKVTLIDDRLIKDVILRSRTHPRRRMIQPLHKNSDAPIHRMLNSLQPDSYILPHRHCRPPKPESVIVLRGTLAAIIFDDTGRITASYRLQADSATMGIDIEAGLFHTFLALHPDTVIFEVKPGPYEISSDKDFAPWAPPADTPAAGEYLSRLHSLMRPE